jgi:hypothetical protein
MLSDGLLEKSNKQQFIESKMMEWFGNPQQGIVKSKAEARGLEKAF